MKNRLITKRQEQIYRLRHHNFNGLTTKQTATTLKVWPQSITRQMRRMKKIAPQLFPILTKRQAEVYYLFIHAGLSQKVIAKILKIKENSVATLIYKLRQKGIFIPRRLHQVLYMSKAHDHQIRQKF